MKDAQSAAASGDASGTEVPISVVCTSLRPASLRPTINGRPRSLSGRCIVSTITLIGFDLIKTMWATLGVMQVYLITIVESKAVYKTAVI